MGINRHYNEKDTKYMEAYLTRRKIELEAEFLQVSAHLQMVEREIVRTEEQLSSIKGQQQMLWPITALG